MSFGRLHMLDKSDVRKSMLRVGLVIYSWLLFSVVVPLHAQLKTHFYHSEHFGMTEGLHHGVIGDVHVTEEGFVWVYTVHGIQLFDGHHFVDVHHPVDEEGLSGEFNASRSGSVFFLTKRALYRLDSPNKSLNARVTLGFPEKAIATRSNIILYENPRYLYIGFPDDSVYQVSKEALQIVHRFRIPVGFHRYLNIGESDIGTALQDQIEYIGKDELLYRFNPADATLDTIASYHDIRSIIKSARDTFIMVDDERLHLLTPSGRQLFPLPDTMQAISGKLLLVTSPGELLVSLQNEFFTFDLRSLRWVSQFRKTGEGNFYNFNLRMLQYDSDQNIYLTTFTSGLVKLYPRNPGFDYIGTANTAKRFVRNISGSDSTNVVLMGTLQDGLYVYDTSGNQLRHFLEFPEKANNPYITAIVKISPSRFWVFASEVYEVRVMPGDVSITKIGDVPVDWHNYYSSGVSSGHHGQYYVSSWNGLLFVRPDSKEKFEYVYQHPMAFRFPIIPFRDGYLGAGADTLMYMDPTMQTVLAKHKLKSLGFARCLTSENDSTILLGTSLGLYRIHIGNTLRVEPRLYNKMVYAILPGHRSGEYWFSSDYGIFHLQDNDHLVQYSIETGIQENEFNTNVSYKSETGKLYFGGINGITAFYPEDVVQSPDSIRHYLSAVLVNNQPFAQYLASTDYRTWDLSHAQSNISVELLGKGHKAPGSYNYQYWMKGFNSKWVNLGNQTKVNFDLAPGTYTFYYHIDDNFKPDALPKNGFAVVIHPPIYRRWWFITAVALGVVGVIVFLIIQHKKKQTMKLMYEYQLNEKLQKERMRISRELHDNIGAQMATVKRNINFLVSHFDNLPKDQVESKMRDLEGISTQINQELRDTIWATQNEHISVGDFITRLKNYVFQTLGHESAFRVIYEEKCDKDVILGPFLALNLHRICQETMNNAFKHAGATELLVCFEGDSEFFKVTIRDNGTGFNIDSIHEGYGLGNIKHRSAQIGASLHFNRGITHGTSLEILIEKLERSNNTVE